MTSTLRSIDKVMKNTRKYKMMIRENHMQKYGNIVTQCKTGLKKYQTLNTRSKMIQ